GLARGRAGYVPALWCKDRCRRRSGSPPRASRVGQGEGKGGLAVPSGRPRLGTASRSFGSPCPSRLARGRANLDGHGEPNDRLAVPSRGRPLGTASPPFPSPCPTRLARGGDPLLRRHLSLHHSAGT